LSGFGQFIWRRRSSSLALEQSVELIAEQMRAEEPTPETMRLLRRIWPSITPADRAMLLSLLGEPPTADEVASWKQDDKLHRRLLRQWRWLAGLKGDLPEDWTRANAALSAAFGEGDPEARRLGVSTYVGDVSDLSAEQIADMGPSKFASWAAEWDPPQKTWMTPTPRGVAGELSSAVRVSPQTWNDALPAVAERLRHPTYIRGLLEGLRTAMKEDKVELPWSGLVAAAELVAGEPWSVDRLTEDEFDADRDWSGAHRVVIDLISEAADRDTPFTDEELERVWDVLLAYLRSDSPPGFSGIDLLTVAINKTSTMALRAMFSVVLSVSRRGGNVEAWGGLLGDAVAEELAKGDSETALVGAIVASLFPQFALLSGDRAYELLPQLFGDPVSADLRVAVLETLFQYARPITNEMLGRFYQHLLSYLRTERSADDEEENRSAVRWLVIGYIRQLEGQDDPHEVLAALSDDSRISEAAEFLGRVLREDSDPQPDLLDAALRFWDAALATPDLGSDAFLGFGWWSEATAIDDDEWLQRMRSTLERSGGRIDWDDQVVQRLIRLRGTPAAWECLSLLVRHAREQWTVSYWARNLHELFRETGEDEAIRGLRTELIERLLERELLDFREYL
jgi:hypothetical protein